MERLRSVGVSGPLLQLLRDYLHGRHMRVVHNGQQSAPRAVTAGVPQVSVLGSLLWNIYINDLLNLVPSAMACVDDITVSLPFTPGEEEATSSRFNALLCRIEDWGRRWQVSFAPQKTQLLVVSRTRKDIRLPYNGTLLTPQEKIKILGCHLRQQADLQDPH